MTKLILSLGIAKKNAFKTHKWIYQFFYFELKKCYEIDKSTMTKVLAE